MFEEKTYRKVRIVFVANVITLAFCLALVLTKAPDESNEQLSLYGMMMVTYGILIAFSIDRRGIYYEILSFIATNAVLGYLYWHTPDSMAMILFYFYAVQIALQYNPRYSLIGSMLISCIYAAVSLSQAEGIVENQLSIYMHSLLIINMNVLVQHLSQLEGRALSQSEKVNQLLNQMESSYKMVSSLAEKDELTTLYNYRSFRQRLNEMQPSNIAILLLDVDYFKVFNDSYGHLCGDAVLRDIAIVLTNSLRERDMVFRYGGEEFAVILQCNNEQEVQAAALRISNNIEQHVFHFGDETELHVTVSIGYGIGNEKIKTAEELFKIADDALYNAKDSGRNLIGCPNGEICTSDLNTLLKVM
ncbi:MULTISPECIES: GGDEF domain-containing protein [Pelosinus]|uniref:Diguanylate cyclase n=1 Tax=Pelosinus fermentans B4 TaxID=1149862 RepID=I8RE22_9FIRM|nr:MULTISPECIES: GGDEF domain-containing protein [Pelosinus]EIW17563.1 diguanylate cyclase [Pelosinus fermentans B4]EIW23300.1 diguanylate cyclase [Pelosinus fermentans A11]OAM92118.1 diguanylate cyclase [Pelosinus fermentans DSM 17108]SDQ33960.1 diguanylate cyclase [Pelosinus fermentans]